MDTSDCVFCNIINRSIDASNILKETDDVVAIRDILPKAPTHLVIVPKTHIESVNDLTDDQADLVGRMVLMARTMAKELGVAETGYKLIFNIGKHGGQTVKHIHLHMLGGKQLSELGI